MFINKNKILAKKIAKLQKEEKATNAYVSFMKSINKDYDAKSLLGRCKYCRLKVASLQRLINTK